MKKSLNLIASLFFLIATGMAFYWLWTQTQNFTVNTAVAENLKPVEVETVKNEAEKLLFGVENKAGIPIPSPVGKMGKENPFK